MTKRMNKTMFLGASLVGMLALSGTTAFALPHTINITATLQNSTTENVSSVMAWGDIDVNPTGTTKCTMDASLIPANDLDCDNGSIASGTITSGQITVESPISFGITITYPANATITDGTTPRTIDAIATYSTPTGAAHTGGTPTYINIGGVLTIDASAGSLDADYTGTMSITLAYE